MKRKERGKMLFEAVGLQSGGSSEGKPETEKEVNAFSTTGSADSDGNMLRELSPSFLLNLSLFKYFLVFKVFRLPSTGEMRPMGWPSTLNRADVFRRLFPQRRLYVAFF
jgi:hypothetical protein